MLFSQFNFLNPGATCLIPATCLMSHPGILHTDSQYSNLIYLACFLEKEFFKWLTIPEYSRESVHHAPSNRCFL